jgi:hypothetical protein
VGKLCKKCGIEKAESEFNKNRANKDGLYDWCRECANAKGREWYHKNKERAKIIQQRYKEAHPDKVKATLEKRRDKKIIYQKQRYDSHKAYLIALKLPCAKCGENRHYVIDFHHIDPTEKSFNVSESYTGRSITKMEAEVAKCVCMCRNCHTEFHHIYGNQPEHPVEAIKEYLGEELFDEQNRIKRSNCRDGERDNIGIEV